MIVERSAPSGWAPTPAHLRAVAMAVVCLGAAALARRPDLAILGIPFVGAAAWGTRHRPTGTTTAAMHLDGHTVFEGQAATVRLSVVGEAPSGTTGDVAAAVLATGPWITGHPRQAARATSSGGGPCEVVVPVRAIRWGRHRVQVARASCTSQLGAYRTVVGPIPPATVLTMPRRAGFGAIDAMPRPAGLVGAHRSRRQGSGSEPAEVRPFRAGDRLRRINWAVSSRTGTLHVTSTWADRDAHVMLLLDTEVDVGVSGGVDGAASSLDIAVRAAAAIGEHYLLRGDRVGLVDLGRRVREVRPGSGQRHLRRLLGGLVAAEAGANRRAEAVRTQPVAAGALVVALTPLAGSAGLQQVVRFARQGHTVVVVDTSPGVAPASGTSWEALATRLRALERAADIDRLGGLGVPVVAWRGPGTLDEVLRDVSRLATAPRLR